MKFFCNRNKGLGQCAQITHYFQALGGTCVGTAGVGFLAARAIAHILLVAMLHGRSGPYHGGLHRRHHQ